MSDLVKRLDIKAGMMEMGEKIAWGSDTELMREAMQEIETLRAQSDALAEALRLIISEECNCINISQKREIAYETGKCPHQVLAKYEEGKNIAHTTAYEKAANKARQEMQGFRDYAYKASTGKRKTGMFEFVIRATEKDPTGYYFPRWDQAENLTVKAETKAEAIKKVKAVLGETGERRGWPWAIAVDSVKEI